MPLERDTCTQSCTLFIQSNSTFNPLSPKSDQHEISPHNINALENMVVVRIEYMIREDESI